MFYLAGIVYWVTFATKWWYLSTTCEEETWTKKESARKSIFYIERHPWKAESTTSSSWSKCRFMWTEPLTFNIFVNISNFMESKLWKVQFVSLRLLWNLTCFFQLIMLKIWPSWGSNDPYLNFDITEIRNCGNLVVSVQRKPYKFHCIPSTNNGVMPNELTWFLACQILLQSYSPRNFIR